MTKKELIEISKRVLKTDSDQKYLLKLEVDDLESPVVLIRDRVEG